MGTNCAPMLADLFLYSYEAEFIQNLPHEKNKPLAVAFNSTFRYIDTMFYRSTTTSFIHMSILYTPVNFKFTYASYLDFLLIIDTVRKLTIQLFDKWNDFNFAIVNFPYTCSSIPLSPAYGVYFFQLIRYTRACSTYDQFLSRGRLQTHKMILQGFLQSRLMSAFCKVYGRYNDLQCNSSLQTFIEQDVV
jgi:hypothetical protein